MAKNDGSAAREGVAESSEGKTPPTPATDKPPYEAIPSLYLEGEVNAEHFRVRVRNLNLLNEWHQRDRGNLLKGYDSTLRGILREAKLCGLRDSEVLDGAGAEDRTLRLLEEMLDTPTINKLLESDDEVLDKFEEGVEAAISGCKRWIESHQDAAEEEADKYRARLQSGKAWTARLKRLRRARSDARDTFPKHRNSKETHALQASRMLRRMLYIMRSDMSDGAKGKAAPKPSELILEIPSHVCDAAVTLWMSLNGIKFYAQGTAAECRSKPELFTPTGGPKKGAYECDGMLWRCPPRHMKTTFGAAWVTDELIENNRLQCFNLHAGEDGSQTNYNMVANNFRRQEDDQAAGRRLHALFPEIRVAKSTNDQTRLKSGEWTKNAQLSWGSIKTGRLGSNVDRLWSDDAVKREEADQDTSREFTHKQMTQMYLNRLQGKRAFALLTFTSWHEDDTHCRLIKQAEKGEINFVVLTHAAGGPKTNPPFREVWSRYPSSWLRQQYNRMNDPHGYACQYMCETQADELKIVKRVGLYLAGFDEDAKPTDCRHLGGLDCGSCHMCQIRQHRKFIAEAEFHLSLDPSATAEKDKKKHTDKSALVWSAFGDVVVERQRQGFVEQSRRTECRMIEARTFYASTSEATEQVQEYCTSHRVDKVHIETVTFSKVIVETLQNQFDLGSNQIIGHSPGNLNKAKRLRAVSSCLDDSVADIGLAPATYRFPGILHADGTITVDERYKWVVLQIQNFGSTGEDHVVDAITQKIKYLASSLRPGEGAVTSQIQASEAESPERTTRQKLTEMYRNEDAEPREPWQEEAEFIVQRHWS